MACGSQPRRLPCPGSHEEVASEHAAACPLPAAADAITRKYKDFGSARFFGEVGGARWVLRHLQLASFAAGPSAWREHLRPEEPAPPR